MGGLSTLTVEERPVTAEDWEPHFRRAIEQYVLEQKGGVTIINCRNLLKFIATRKGYPVIETEEQQTRVSKLLTGFLKEYIGPLWDGAIYIENSHSKGRSVVVGTDNLLGLIRYKGAAKP